MKIVKLKIIVTNLETGEELRVDECLGTVELNGYLNPLPDELPGPIEYVPNRTTRIMIEAKTMGAVMVSPKA